MNIEKILYIAILFFISFLIFSLTIFLKIKGTTAIIIQSVSFIILIIGGFLIYLKDIITLRAYESNFTFFIRDLTECLRGGLNIVSALESLKKNDYKELNPLIKKLVAEVKAGIPFDLALQRLAKRTNSKLILKMCLTIGQSIKSGGDVADILDAISKSAMEIEKIRRERKLHLSSLTLNLYIIYFVFLAIIIVILRFLIPELIKNAQMKVDMNFLKNVIFRNMIIIQGLFIGLNIGNIVEGSFIAGIRHALIMIIAGLIIWIIFL